VYIKIVCPAIKLSLATPLVWGHALPPGNFEKIEARRWDLVAFQPLDKVGKLFYHCMQLLI